MVSWNHTTKSSAQKKNGNVASTVASWCPPLDLWYTIGKRGSEKRKRVDADGLRRFSEPVLTWKEMISSSTRMTSAKPICNQENNCIADRAACCDGDVKLNLLSSDSANASDHCVTNMCKSKSKKRLRLRFNDRIPSEDTFEEEPFNIVTLSQKEIEDDFLKMTGKTLPRNGNPCMRLLKGYFPGTGMKRLKHHEA